MKDNRDREQERDGLVIEASLLLDYHKVGLKTYESVGVQRAQVQRAPFFSWLPSVLKTDLEDAAMMQAARDARLSEKLFDYKAPVWEQPALDLAHLFIEAGRSVHVVSHETPDALDAIIARAGLPDTVSRWPLTPTDRRHDVLKEVLSVDDATWLAVYDVGLTRKEEQRIVETLAGRGVLVNVDKPTTRGGDDALLRVIEERWLL